MAVSTTSAPASVVFVWVSFALISIWIASDLLSGLGNGPCEQDRAQTGHDSRMIER